MLSFYDNGGCSSQGSADDFAPLLEELEHATDEHPDVSASNADGIAISVFGTRARGYRVALEDAEEDSIPIQHVGGFSADDVIRLARMLDEDGVDAILAAADWQPGY